MTDQQTLYAFKPDRCLVTVSEQALNLHKEIDAKLPAGPIGEHPTPHKTEPKTPSVPLFHHPV